MSRVKQRNLVILVAVVVGLLVGVVVLANYSGILQAESKQQSQPKVSCSKDRTACAVANKETCEMSAAFASVETTEASGCCAADKAVGCAHSQATACEKEAGCEKAAACGGCGDGCEDKAASCSHEKSTGCCGEPKAEGCSAAENESTT